MGERTHAIRLGSNRSSTPTRCQETASATGINCRGVGRLRQGKKAGSGPARRRSGAAKAIDRYGFARNRRRRSAPSCTTIGLGSPRFVDRANLPHDLPPNQEAFTAGVTSGPKKPELVRAFTPMGYDCRSESAGSFTLRRRTPGNLTAELIPRCRHLEQPGHWQFFACWV